MMRLPQYSRADYAGLRCPNPLPSRTRFTSKSLTKGNSSRVVCRAEVITGEAYEDIIDTLAHRAIRLATTTATTSGQNDCLHSTSNSTSSTSNGIDGNGNPLPQQQQQQQQQQARPRRVLVGLAGPPGSGKSTLAAEVAARINQIVYDNNSKDVPYGSSASCCSPSSSPPAAAAARATTAAEAGESLARAPYAVVLPMDGFHYYRRELDAMPDPKEAHARRGAPWTFDAAKFVAAVRRVRQAAAEAHEGGAAAAAAAAAAEEVRVPSFDHGVGDPVEEDIVIPAEAAVVLVEGNYLLLPTAPWLHLRPLLAESWYLACPLDTAMRRVFERQTQLGLQPEESLARIASNDRPNAELVEAAAAAADLIVRSDVPYRRAAAAEAAALADSL